MWENVLLGKREAGRQLRMSSIKSRYISCMKFYLGDQDTYQNNDIVYESKIGLGLGGRIDGNYWEITLFSPW